MISNKLFETDIIIQYKKKVLKKARKNQPSFIL